MMGATRLEPASICSKLKFQQVTSIELNYIVLFAAISLAQSNLSEDSIAPARRPFKGGCWPSDPPPIT